jgi:hypothetical protein
VPVQAEKATAAHVPSVAQHAPEPHGPLLAGQRPPSVQVPTVQPAVVVTVQAVPLQHAPVRAQGLVTAPEEAQRLGAGLNVLVAALQLAAVVCVQAPVVLLQQAPQQGLAGDWQ